MRFDPYERADKLGIEVIHRRLETANGMWIPEHNLIVIRQGMRAAWDRSTLAHELGHAELGHRDDRPRHEVAADRHAAKNLIDLDECRDLMRWMPDMHKLAAELGVTTRLVQVFLAAHHQAA